MFDFSLPEEFLPLISKIVNKSVKLSPDIVSDIKRGLRPDTGKFKDRFFIGLDEFSHLTADEKRLYKKHIRGEDIIGKYRVAWKGEYVKFEPEKMAEGGKKELYEQPKIVIKEIGKNLRASYDNEKYYCAKSIHLILEENSKADLKYLTALLNSQLLDFYFKSRFYLNRLGRGSFRYREQFLKQFPIKLPQTPAEQKLADEITSLVEQILSLAKTEQRVEGFPDPYFDELLDSGEIDEFDEIRWTPKRAYKDLEPQAAKEEWARVIVIGKNDVISSSKIYNDIREKYVIESLRGKNFSKDKEVIIRIPRSDSAIEKILSQLEADKKRLAQTPISELEDDINELVYELYGLDEEDKKVIEEFLERF
ncbi:MAG: hypothetical protein D6808_07540 [Candidatus Dadabacteria bacterium]|nr:MAG: hypothetical protein D6808_07540 [Candidatus Dadabacteria bacterium]